MHIFAWTVLTFSMFSLLWIISATFLGWFTPVLGGIAIAANLGISVCAAYMADTTEWIE